MPVERVVEVAVESRSGRFHLCRQGSAWAADQIASEGRERGLGAAVGFVFVRTVRTEGTTPLRIEVLDARPVEPVLHGAHHIAEVSLSSGGDLDVFDGPSAGPPRATVPVPAGPLRLRAAWVGLDATRVHETDDDGTGDESLVLQLWPEDPHEPELVRCWEPWRLPPPRTTTPQVFRQIEGEERVRSRIAVLEHVADLPSPRPSMPGSGPGSMAHAIYRDPADGSWWVDGTDWRRTLRQIHATRAEALLDPTSEPIPIAPRPRPTQRDGERTTELGPNRRFTIRFHVVGDRIASWGGRSADRHVDCRVVTPLSERRAIGLALERLGAREPDAIWEDVDVVGIETDFTWGDDDLVDMLAISR